MDIAALREVEEGVYTSNRGYVASEYWFDLYNNSRDPLVRLWATNRLHDYCLQNFGHGHFSVGDQRIFRRSRRSQERDLAYADRYVYTRNVPRTVTDVNSLERFYRNRWQSLQRSGAFRNIFAGYLRYPYVEGLIRPGAYTFDLSP